jgi:hypothetical protein
MDSQGIVLAVVRDCDSSGVDQRPGKLGQCDTGISIEPPSGLGGGKGLSRGRQDPQSSGDPLKGCDVFLDQAVITPLEACIVGRQRSDILILYARAV